MSLRTKQTQQKRAQWKFLVVQLNLHNILKEMCTEYGNIVDISPFSDLILHISISFYTLQDHFTGLDTFHLYIFLSMIFSLKFSFLFLCTICSRKQNLILQIFLYLVTLPNFTSYPNLQKKESIRFVHYLVVFCVYINFPETQAILNNTGHIWYLSPSGTVFNFLLIFGNHLNIIIYYTHFFFFQCLLDIYIKKCCQILCNFSVYTDVVKSSISFRMILFHLIHC